jgi:protease I
MKIVCLLDSMFEDSEFQKPYDAFREAGHEVTIVGQSAGKEVKGYRGIVTTRTEKSIDDVRPEDFDALFIPGGYSPDHLRINKKVVDFTRTFVGSGRPTFAICHGPQLLITAKVVDGRTLTAWPTIQDDLSQVGARVVDQEVAVDGNLVTSRKPDDIPAFTRESIKMLEKVPADKR